MKNWLRQFGLILVMMALPLQGMAATLHALSCLSTGDDHPVVHAQAHDHDGSHGVPHGHDGDTGKSDSAHLCCNLVAPAMLAIPAATPPADAAVYTPSISLLATLFIPEQPQRPPRS